VRVQPPIDVVRAATTTAAELMRMEGEVGFVAEGARADLLVVDGEPAGEPRAARGAERHIKAILKRLYKDEIPVER
jgi:imidazolonepropionase-like amidohydrolase